MFHNYLAHSQSVAGNVTRAHLKKGKLSVVTEVMILTCHMPSPVCVIFSADNVFLSFGGGSILGGVCKITNSLNITDEPRLLVDVGGLSKLELAEF